MTLNSGAALDPAVAGAKAAALARALRSGLPVLPGWVLTTSAFTTSRAGRRRAPGRLVGGDGQRPAPGGRPVVLHGRGRQHQLDGRHVHLRPRRGRLAVVPGRPSTRSSTRPRWSPRTPAPIAVLIQPQLMPTVGGVLFGIDPVTGRTDHVVVSASEAGPAAVVGGTVDGSRYVLSRRRMVEGPERRPAQPRPAAPAAGPRPPGGAGVRRAAGRGVGVRARRAPVAAAEPSGHRRRRPRRAPAPRSVPAPWPRPSPSRCRPSRRTSGSSRCATGCGPPSPSPAPPSAGASPPRRW